MIIYGAGMAGLIAGNMLRRTGPEIREIQPFLPDNHGALLRFRSDAVSRVTGIPFKKVRVDKAICFDGKVYSQVTPKFNNLYSRKVTGEVHSRSILDLSSSIRYIAPADFTRQLSRGLSIRYGSGFEWIKRKEPVISTVPMPALMKLSGWEDVPSFKHLEIWSVCAKITDPKVDVYQTLYYPDLYIPYYRASICGDILIVEYLVKPSEDLISEQSSVCFDFGILDPKLTDYSTKYQKFGKILPIDERARRQFILAMTDMYEIYSLGRFATWRQILLDDVVKDVERIKEWVEERDFYKRKKDLTDLWK